MDVRERGNGDVDLVFAEDLSKRQRFGHSGFGRVEPPAAKLEVRGDRAVPTDVLKVAARAGAHDGLFDAGANSVEPLECHQLQPTHRCVVGFRGDGLEAFGGTCEVAGQEAGAGGLPVARRAQSGPAPVA